MNLQLYAGAAVASVGVGLLAYAAKLTYGTAAAAVVLGLLLGVMGLSMIGDSYSVDVKYE